MFYSKEYKCIFIRHQKTASQSIREALPFLQKPFEHFDHACQYKYIQNVDPNVRYDPHHVPFFEFDKFFNEIIPDPQNYFKFSFSRNPWSRLVSAWKYSFCTKGMKYYGKVNFSEFIMSHRNAWPCVEMNTLDFSAGCDFIGKVENLQEDFDFICDKIGAARTAIPRKNTTIHHHYTEYYNEKTKDIVAQNYKKDIEYFGYEFGQ
jgi:hypothetical protein